MGFPSFPYERCNSWLLYAALGWGVDKVRFVCLWKGGGGGGPGGTRHMHDEVKRRTGPVTWIDTRALKSGDALDAEDEDGTDERR